MQIAPLEFWLLSKLLCPPCCTPIQQPSLISQRSTWRSSSSATWRWGRGSQGEVACSDTYVWAVVVCVCGDVYTEVVVMSGYDEVFCVGGSRMSLGCYCFGRGRRGGGVGGCLLTPSNAGSLDCSASHRKHYAMCIPVWLPEAHLCLAIPKHATPRSATLR